MSCQNCENYKDYDSDNLFTWCTACGNYGIMAAMKRALVAEEVKPKDALICFDIGCNGNGADKVGGYRFHGLHGRAIPFACGAAVANRGVHVLASAGDGATFSEGINHLVHAIRNNYDVTFILHNNSNYGLTTGQPSATTRKGQHMNLAPDGVFLEPINALEFALSLNPTFAARTFSGNVNQMTEIIRAGIQHKGFSFIEVLQHCPSYNKATPHEWYQERVYDTLDIEEYDNSNLAWAKILAADLDHKIATGILYQRTDAADFLGMQAARKGITTELVNEVGPVDVTPLVGMFR